MLESASSCAGNAFLLHAPLDKSGSERLQRQLYRRFKDGILNGQVFAGTRLPSSRSLAQSLSISRNTVTIAYEHLLSEGYLVTTRRGVSVAPVVPTATPARSENQAAAECVAARRVFGIRPGELSPANCTILAPAVPALSHFPLAAWRNALDRTMRDATPTALNYGDPFGQMALRTAIARHLTLTRGVRCDAQQLIVTEGSQEALILCVRLLSNPGDTAWIEDPGYRGAQAAMSAGDLKIVPKRVDAQGLKVEQEDWSADAPRLIYTTPSHQFPMGSSMSKQRRMDLIAQARKHGTWIIEDDYDGDFWHAGEPVGAMQGMEPDAPVVYVGSFSKTMFPSLRLGFLVLPKELLAMIEQPLRDILCGGHCHEQLAMASFMESGHFTRHLSRMRRLYRDRQQALRDALAQHFNVPHTVEGGRYGMHLCVRLPAQFEDRKIVEAARRLDMGPRAISNLSLSPTSQDNGLILGYGNTSVDSMEPMIKRLATICNQIVHPLSLTQLDARSWSQT